MTNNRFGRNMRTADLEVGQKLFDASTDTWGRTIGSITTYTIARMTKTRLILTRDGTEPPIETRVIVRDGAVSHKVEGQSEWASGVTLYTADDPELEELRVEVHRTRVLNKARAATAEFDKKRDRESALYAILTLQKFVDLPEIEQ